MAKDIFGGDAVIGGAWTLDGAILRIEGGNDLVAIGTNIQYGRDLTEYHPLNQDKRYLVSGLGQGTVSIDSIVGPSKGVADFIKRYADICNADKNVISITPVGPKACNGTNPVTFICAGAVLQTVSLSLSTQGTLTMIMATTVLRINNLQIK